jgi:hypothetical protein
MAAHHRSVEGVLMKSIYVAMLAVGCLALIAAIGVVTLRTKQPEQKLEPAQASQSAPPLGWNLDEPNRTDSPSLLWSDTVGFTSRRGSPRGTSASGRLAIW